MFIGCYKKDNIQYNFIYYKNINGFREWQKDIFSLDTENIQILDLCVKGKTYCEKKDSLIDIAKQWQLEFSQFNWSYNELITIEDFIYKNAKRYGLLKEFKENGVC